MFDPTYPIPPSRHDAILPLVYWVMTQPEADITLALNGVTRDVLAQVMQFRRDQAEVLQRDIDDDARRLREAF